MEVYHLYSDGNSFPRAKKSGFGGYIESPTGEIIVEYSEQIKQPNYLFSFELLGIIRGLEIAKSNGIQHIISHCDDKNTATKLIEIFDHNTYSITPSMKPELYDKIIELSKDFKSVKFEYIPRNLNKHADSLSRKYAQLMEENFLKQYIGELASSQKKLASGQKANKRIFFDHPNMVQTINKNNPFLIANVRNKKVRKISRDEEKDTYSYMFFEFFSIDNKTKLKCFNYNSKKELLNINEKTIENDDANINSFNSFIAENINNVDTEKLWLYSNSRNLNAIFERKEKLKPDDSISFIEVYDSMSNINKIFYHNLPFEHKFSSEIAPVEKKKEELDNNIENLDSLLERFTQSDFIKDKGKCFGAIIRHQLREYKSKLEREINEIEVNDVINKTITTLNQKGFTDLPYKVGKPKTPGHRENKSNKPERVRFRL